MGGGGRALRQDHKSKLDLEVMNKYVVLTWVGVDKFLPLKSESILDLLGGNLWMMLGTPTCQ